MNFIQEAGPLRIFYRDWPNRPSSTNVPKFFVIWKLGAREGPCKINPCFRFWPMWSVRLNIQSLSLPWMWHSPTWSCRDHGYMSDFREWSKMYGNKWGRLSRKPKFPSRGTLAAPKKNPKWCQGLIKNLSPVRSLRDVVSLRGNLARCAGSVVENNRWSRLICQCQSLYLSTLRLFTSLSTVQEGE